MRKPWLTWLLFTPFVASVFGPWAWFNTIGARPSTLDSGPRIWLQARTNIPGYTFIPEPVSETVMKTLGTTNILSGTFYRTEDGSQRSEHRGRKSEPTSDFQPQTSAASDFRPSTSVPRKHSQVSDLGHPASELRPLASDRITIFLATWSAESKKPLLMLGHTPDICWTGAGWKPIDLGQPSQVLIELPIPEGRRQRSEVGDQSRSLPSVLRPPSSRPVPFSFRAFEAPDRNRRELAVWCMLVGGQPLGSTAPENGQNTSHSLRAIRRNMATQFWDATKNRLPVRGAKQFARYSAPILGDLAETLELLTNRAAFQAQNKSVASL